jgi:cell division protease FtsH
MSERRESGDQAEPTIEQRGEKDEAADTHRLPHRPPNQPWRTEGLPPGSPGGPPKKPFNWWAFVAQTLVLYAVAFAILTYLDGLDGIATISYSEFVKEVEAGNVAEVFARGESIQGTLAEPRPVPGVEQTKTKYQRFSTERPVFARDDLLAKLEAHGTTVRATPVVQERGPLANLLISLAPILLWMGFSRWLLKRQQGGLGGMFGMGGGKKKPVDPSSVRVTFADVAGIDEVKGEITEIVDYLRDPGKYRAVGARPPKGVLLSGAPGTGKTLLARATAGEAKVPFFSASASEFIEMIVGVGASRVRELFQAAREAAPAIIFIDEIDTIGRARAGTLVGGHDEREQTLNQILTEMDGFSGAEGVIVLAATNRPDVLDPALLRPGRFDRNITIHPPDQVGRRDILRVHVRKVRLATDVDLDEVARATPGLTGADLANLVNEAALLAVRRGRADVSASDLADALEKVQLGTARHVVIPAEERRRTAYHEAGHALLGMLQPGADPVRKISIIPRGRALGVTLSTPQEDRYGYDAAYLRGRMIGALGGLTAEEVVLGVPSTGAESDLQTCTAIARSMVGRWGMSERIGPVSVLPPEGDPRMLGVSEGMLDAVGDEVRRLVDECHREARSLLTQNRGRLDALARGLLEHETLDESAAYATAGIPQPTSGVTPGGPGGDRVKPGDVGVGPAPRDEHAVHH